MRIEITYPMTVRLAEYLDRELIKRIVLYGRDYTMTDMAREIGIEDATLSAILAKKGKQAGSKAISFDTLRKLITYFGKDFTDAFGLTPPEVPRGKLERAREGDE